MKGSIYRSVEAGDRIGEIKLARKGTYEWCYMYSGLTYTGKGLSTLKEHPKSKPHADQNQDKDVKLWT